MSIFTGYSTRSGVGIAEPISLLREQCALVYITVLDLASGNTFPVVLQQHDRFQLSVIPRFHKLWITNCCSGLRGIDIWIFEETHLENIA